MRVYGVLINASNMFYAVMLVISRRYSGSRDELCYYRISVEMRPT